MLLETEAMADDKKDQRIPVMMSTDEVAAIDEWRRPGFTLPLRSHPSTARTGAEGEEVTSIDEDLKLIRQIVAGGGRKYTAGNIRSRYDRLVDLGWLTPFKTNISDVEYQVTVTGRAAAAF